MVMQQLDVAIIGGGPGGLTAAHAIQTAAPRLTVGVFERSRTIERRGAGLGLDINGQKALKAIKPELHRKLCETAAFLHTTKVMAADGQLTAAVPTRNEIRLELERQGIKTPCLLGWSELQQLLLDELPDPTCVHLGMEFERYVEGGDHVMIYFKDQPHPVRASILVASDGYFSRVRRQCTADGPPEFTGTIMWRARLPAETAAGTGIDMKGASVFVQDYGRFLFCYPISSGDVVWTAGISDEKLQELGMSAADLLLKMQNSRADYTKQESQGYSQQQTAKGEAAKERCLQALEGFSEPMCNFIARTPARSLVEHGVFIRRPSDMSSEAYGKGRVAIIGDAAHPMRPTGQGLNQTVEDCWFLGKALLAANSINQRQLTALQDFRQQRCERMKPIMAHTMAVGAAAYTKKNDDKDRDQVVTGQNTDVMTAQQFQDLLYAPCFEGLDSLLHSLMVAA